jgi:hypothetical protein
VELLKVVEKSLSTEHILTPVYVLENLKRKMEDYRQSMAGEGPSPLPTKQNEAAKEVRQVWNPAFRKWGNLASSLKKQGTLELWRVKAFLESDALKDFEQAWNDYPHDEPPTIDRSGDELKLLSDFESKEVLRLKLAGDVEQARKDVEKLKGQLNADYKSDYKALLKLATPEQGVEHEDLIKGMNISLVKDKEDWIEGRKLYERTLKLLAALRDEQVFGEQRRDNRDSFKRRVDSLGKAIDQLVVGKTLAEERKSRMRKDRDALALLLVVNERDLKWEPSADNQKQLVALWSELNQCRSDTGEPVEKEPTITVVHGGKIAGEKNKWKAWADKVSEIDRAFTSGLLGFSSDMKLTGNPGCRFHKQGKHWKFYLDEAEMGGSTTMRGWYLPEKVPSGFQVTFVAISDSHSGPTEKILYGDI